MFYTNGKKESSIANLLRQLGVLFLVVSFIFTTGFLPLTQVDYVYAYADSPEEEGGPTSDPSPGSVNDEQSHNTSGSGSGGGSSGGSSGGGNGDNDGDNNDGSGSGGFYNEDSHVSAPPPTGEKFDGGENKPTEVEDKGFWSGVSDFFSNIFSGPTDDKKGGQSDAHDATLQTPTPAVEGSLYSEEANRTAPPKEEEDGEYEEKLSRTLFGKAFAFIVGLINPIAGLLISAAVDVTAYANGYPGTTIGIVEDMLEDGIGPISTVPAESKVSAGSDTTSPDGGSQVNNDEVRDGYEGPVNSIVIGAPPKNPFFMASESEITLGESVALTWECYDSNSSSGVNFKTGGAVSGSVILTPDYTTEYLIGCSNNGLAYEEVVVDNPFISITAEPDLLQPNSTSVITWSASDVNSCTVTENNSNIEDSWSGLSGSQITSPIAEQTIYTLFCETDLSPYRESVKIELVPSYQEI